VFLHEVTVDGVPGKIIDVNNVVCSLLGYTREELLQLSHLDLVAPEQMQRVPTLRDKLQANKNNIFEIVTVTKYGKRLVFEIDNHLFNLNGQPTVLAIARDITDRKKAEEELQQSEEMYRTLFENTGTAMMIVDEDMTISHINDEMVKVSGYSKEEIEGRVKWLELVVQDDLERLLKNHRLRRIDQEAAPTSYEFQFIHKRGDVRDASLTVTMIPGTEKSVASFMDITERKQAEKERDGLLKELETKNREMGQFTYTVSHDLRSPLVTIQGFTTMLQKVIEQNEQERAENDLKYIESAVTKMSALLSDTLELSRIGRIVNPPEDVPFGDIVKDALEQTAGDLNAHTIDVSVAEDFPTVHVDRMWIVEVLVNFITNSIKYRGDQPHPEIEIGYRVAGNETVFFVKDNGMGIDKSQYEKVFELFYRVDKGGEGTGAGLAIVKRIIKVHGGRIWIESEKGKGCTVCFTLPVR